jgi:hypothetical protein
VLAAVEERADMVGELLRVLVEEGVPGVRVDLQLRAFGRWCASRWLFSVTIIGLLSPFATSWRSGG